MSTQQPLGKIRNIGEKTSGWLREVGVTSEEDLHRLGSVEVYKRLKARFPDKVTLNALWGLEAALLGISYLQLTDDIKAALRAQLDE
ncbi:MAG: TfoX/Sxy family DNA transformation protein [Chloroflexota bacterium]|nr:TfoX/Sxy family DNA transformation protein [Chloroflexota bacterium]